MLIAALLIDSGNIHCQDDNNSSKKRVIENLSHHLAVNTEVISEDKIFQALLERERLGSTGLGKGVAIPHARIPGLSHTVAAMMTLSSPIKYDAADKQPVDIIFGLLVPEDNSEDHLEHLSRLVSMFRDPQICQSIRETTDADKMFDLLLAIDDD
ncbi:MAG: PTS sugar transporter subunit IIA [Gammaproteobacteria bacterium]|nr:MAG: PTS sugar transporter subunit IIA [Gammaproteobacteria bacterium]